MKLFERLEYLHASPAKLAATFAEYMRHDPAAARTQIGQELAAILGRREELVADLERLAEEWATRCSAWRDFADIPGMPQPGKGAELANIEADNAARAEAESVRVEVEAKISALDLLFCEICRALDFEGLNITSGEISALKRYVIPQPLAAELEAIQKGKNPTIPEAERLSAEDAATLYKELARAGLISGPLEAFIYHFGPLSSTRPKRENIALSWLGTGAQFAFFAWRLSMYMQPGPYGYAIRRKALYLAFEIDQRKARNTMGPYMAEYRGGARASCKGGEQIKRIFETLPGSKEHKENVQ